MLKKIIWIRKDWHGEYRIMLGGGAWSFCYLTRKDWPNGWAFSIRTQTFEHGLKTTSIRALGFEVRWNR